MEGVITNEETKELVENAKLTFTPQDEEATEETTTTDANGAFQIELTPAKYVLTITADDFENKEIEFEVKEGENYSGEKFEITPGLEEGIKIELQWKKDPSVDLTLHVDAYYGDDLRRNCFLEDIERYETSEYVTETVTIDNMDDLRYWYCCSWNNYDNREAGMKVANGATIKVYLPGKSVETITLNCPSDEYNFWEVCSGDKENLSYRNATFKYWE